MCHIKQKTEKLFKVILTTLQNAQKFAKRLINCTYF